MKQVQDQSFYHIQKGSQRISNVGDILDIGTTENQFLGFYRSFDLNSLPPQAAYNELRRYFREEIFEEVRKEEHPETPSRYFCLWIIPDMPSLKERLQFWIPQVVGDLNQTFRILRLSCTGYVHYANQKFLDLEKCSSIQRTRENAIKYWKGDDVSVDLPSTEVLFVGQAKVTEVIDPFDPTHQG